MMNWLLLFIPAAVGLELLALERYLLIFIASSLSILPLAWWMGRATEELAERLGEAIGGLLNATFRNAAELIIALTALHAGLHDVVKASIAGSIIGNILLVLGAAMFAGGLRHPEQHFNPAGARSQATMLTLAAIALVLPATFQAAANTKTEGLNRLSVSISVVLLVAYLLNLVYALITHPALFAGSYVPEKGKANISVRRASAVLAARVQREANGSIDIYGILSGLGQLRCPCVTSQICRGSSSPNRTLGFLILRKKRRPLRGWKLANECPAV
jgi:Ca2+:H+ antiporter